MPHRQALRGLVGCGVAGTGWVMLSGVLGALTVPQGEGGRLLDELLSRENHAACVGSLTDDPELATA
ncbi:MAG: hypothetical protein OXH20_05765 [bacterium]|nr:hypothetical protein [bacterium]MDE0667905.1 hypothetical protein [bacterium]